MMRWIEQPGGLITAALAGICAVLLALMALQRLFAGGDVDRPVAVSPRDASVGEQLSAREFELPSLGEYAEITARPLFSEDRRPEVHEAGDGPGGTGGEEVAAAADPPAVTLTGVIITPEARVAMLDHNERKEQMALKQGDSLEGWKLESVEERRVVFATGSAEQAMLLEVYTGPSGGARREGGREQAAANEEEQNQSAADMIRERIARERERRRELIEQARQRQDQQQDQEQ